jgi:signal transduction histidine kinase
MQADLLRLQGKDPERLPRAPADVIERAAHRMSGLVQDLLDVTRIEAGHLTLDPYRVDAGQVIRECAEALRPHASAASLELELELTQGTPEVWADRHRLLQVFENLISNAIKFTAPGGQIRIGAGPRDGEVLFWVRDSGTGIAAESLQHVFDRFWQAQKGERRGAGLGLPIVKGIVEAHGGRIWVESALDRGSVFFFTIPVASGAERWRAEHAPHAH